MLSLCLQTIHNSKEDEDDSFNEDHIESREVEPRSYLTNNQIKNKFKNQYNLIKTLQTKITTQNNLIQQTRTRLTKIEEEKQAQEYRFKKIEEDIATLKTNQDYIKDSLQVKCKYLDELLDTSLNPSDCCISGEFSVVCFERFTATALGFGNTKDCPVCPDFGERK